jgi:hypothetical protein
MSQRIQRENIDFLRRVLRGTAQKMYTGRIDPVTDEATLAGAQTNKTWVREGENVRGDEQVWGIALVPNVPVWVEDGPDGRYITGVVWNEGTVKFGSALPGLVQPLPMGDVTGMTVDGLNFKPGRMRKSSLGFPYVHFDPFHFQDGYWRGGELSAVAMGGLDQTANDLDITAYLPATSGHVGWLAGYLDPVDGETYLVAGATQFGDISTLDEADVHAILLPYAVYPLDAVAVANAMTGWGNNPRFVDTRLHHAANGIVNSGWLVKTDTTIPTGASMVQAGTIRSTASLTIHGDLYNI